jgi:hypothetical protein
MTVSENRRRRAAAPPPIANPVRRGIFLRIMLQNQARRGTDMSDCLHCDINDLVQSYIDRAGGPGGPGGTGGPGSDANIADLAAKIAESLADLILLAPEAEQSKLMADAIGSFGNAFLEKSGAVESGESGARH